MKQFNNKNNVPFKSIWFGNFFEPAFNDKEYVYSAIKDIEEMGFTSVELDSKSWQDFFDRYDGKPASDYVEMQEYMMECIKNTCLDHWFLAIYLNGDNLYPSIRFSPPVIGEGVLDKEGNPLVHYRYWSQKAQDSMLEHVNGLFSIYSNNHTEINIDNNKMLPICSMWDPIVKPSFDQDGINRYHLFLKQRHEDVELLNKNYHTNVADVLELSPSEYWVDNYPTTSDFENKTPDYYKYADNQLYKSWELVEHFCSMYEQLKNQNKNYFLMPNISQWGVFLNINSKVQGDLWDTANRGVDPYRIAPYVDNATFMTVPMLPDGTANAYVTEYQNSMMRAMNAGKPFNVGFYLGRHVANDIYRELTPAEIIGSAVASGACGYHAYGYCGLDDGGVMHKMSKLFKQSIKDANGWMDTVIPKIKGERMKQIALLFPSQMATVESYSIDGNEQRRLDSIGMYQLACDCGMMVDVIHIDQVEKDALDQYDVFMLPQNSCYELEASFLAEEKIRNFVINGGTVISSSDEPIAKKVFNITGNKHNRECIRFNEGFIPTGGKFLSFDKGEVIAHYEDSKQPAVVLNTFEKGKVYSFGYAIGSEYLSKTNEAVPPQYGNKVYYPLNLSDNDPCSTILKSEITPLYNFEKGISFSKFDNGVVIVNHTSYPYDTSDIKGTKYFIHSNDGKDILAGHSAVFIEF